MQGVVELSFWDVLCRLLSAVVCGGIIGIERGRKHRPAGFRTHMLVCMGAALTIILSIYLSAMITGVWSLESTDSVMRVCARRRAGNKRYRFSRCRDDNNNRQTAGQGAYDRRGTVGISLHGACYRRRLLHRSACRQCIYTYDHNRVLKA